MAERELEELMSRSDEIFFLTQVDFPEKEEKEEEESEQMNFCEKDEDEEEVVETPITVADMKDRLRNLHSLKNSVSWEIRQAKLQKFSRRQDRMERARLNDLITQLKEQREQIRQCINRQREELEEEKKQADHAATGFFGRIGQLFAQCCSPT